MTSVRVVPMADADLARWRADQAAAGAPLPGRDDVDDWRALDVVAGDVVVGGAVLTLKREGPVVRCAVRLLQTTVPAERREVWSHLADALAAHAREWGADVVTTAVAPALAGAFQHAGYLATMTGVSKRLDPDAAPELQDDRRVAVRPMTPEERQRFAEEAREFLRAGMERAGVLPAPGAPMARMDDQLRRIAGASPPDDELLMTGTMGPDGEPVGRAWATLVRPDGPEGPVDFLGNTLDLFEPFRGQGLTKSLLGALVRHVRALGVRDVHLRVYAHDAAARRTFLEHGAGVDDVHLRREL
ncbi:hypothetical protein GCM10023340_10910 [Nocardioides marinquilinus]|uniref:N-acetyltransferase domain-containing protein n=1 Tax=Nocardioides marinquilinus TaxID=1210400 RepID=A0ABP9PDI3_9ACTN